MLHFFPRSPFSLTVKHSIVFNDDHTDSSSWHPFLPFSQRASSALIL